ncbi:MAG: NAD(P)/FAD-dependent oxidoreductase [Pseudomonadota bacterium]|nr:NAD(P)/FAD-dependent oxidoreductase [Pseudomonadota bacterium]
MRFDVAIVGAGAAGLHCAALAGRRGLGVVVIDHAAKVAEKIRISGGGRCNFTNLDVGPANFESANPDYCRSALARYTPQDFIALVEAHGIAWHEKHRGQLFCDGSSQQIIDLLLAECTAGNVVRWQPCGVREVRRQDSGFVLRTDRGEVEAEAVVVASGGLSIPKIGASDWGLALARQFGHALVEPRPGLVPFTVGGQPWTPFRSLSGVALPVRCAASRASFDDDLLVTHRGLSGPAALQASTYWRPGEAIEIDLAPGIDLAGELRAAKAASTRRLLPLLAELLPRRFAEAWLAEAFAAEAGPAASSARVLDRPLAEWRDRDLDAVAGQLHRWRVEPSGTEGYAKAEVTAGGVDTHELDSRSGQSRRQPGLYFIGEVVDVTGWLGGYNFQWAWASAAACAAALASNCRRSPAPL